MYIQLALNVSNNVMFTWNTVSTAVHVLLDVNVVILVWDADPSYYYVATLTVHFT